VFALKQGCSEGSKQQGRRALGSEVGAFLKVRDCCQLLYVK
jgi:hypothetical protein